MKNDEKKTVRYPPPFRVKDGCLYQQVVNKNAKYERKLCNFTPYLVGEITQDDGLEEHKRLRLGGYREDGSPLPEIEIDGSDLGSFNWLLEKWGVDCILEMGATVKDAIRYAIQLTSPKAERITVYTVTGWKKIDDRWRYLLPGDSRYDVQLAGKLKGYRKEDGLESVDIPGVSRMTDMLAAPAQVQYTLLAYTFLTPLNEFLHRAGCEPRFVYFLTGRTGTRKSTLAALFLSFFGSFTASELPLSFRDTANSIMYHAFALKDVLTCIDDFHPCGRQEETRLTATAQSIMRAYGDRVGRGRLRADASPMESRPPQGNAIVTGEFPPEIGQSGIARYFSVELKEDDVDLTVLTTWQNAARDGMLRRCLNAYVAWIEHIFLRTPELEKEFIYVLGEYFKEYREAFSSSGIRCHGRVPEIVAWLRIGWKMYLTFMKDQGMFTKETADALENQFADILYELARKQSASIEQDKPTHIFIRKLYALLESGQAIVLNKSEHYNELPSSFVGYEDDQYLYLSKDIAHRMVKKLCDEQGELFPVTSRTLLQMLADEKLIDTYGGGNTKAVRFGEVTKRVICLNKSKAELIRSSS